MNSTMAHVRSAEPVQTSDSATGVECRRVDVTGLPADRVAEYLQVADDREDVYFERRAGKTYVVAPDSC